MGYDRIQNVASDEQIALALAALCWTLEDAARSDRLLALTGLSAATLRAQADDPATLAAIIGFLEAHEPDLIACATALDVDPMVLIRTRLTLGQP